MGMEPNMGTISVPAGAPAANMPAPHAGMSLHTKELLAFAAVVVLVVMGVGYWWYRSWQAAQDVQTLQDLNAALNESAAPTTTVPTTVDPLKAATPAVNPTQKTNPFTPKNNAYQNPF